MSGPREKPGFFLGCTAPRTCRLTPEPDWGPDLPVLSVIWATQLWSLGSLSGKRKLKVSPVHLPVSPWKSLPPHVPPQVREVSITCEVTEWSHPKLGRA